MQIFSICKNACYILNFVSQLKLHQLRNISNFKLAFPASSKIYFIVLAVLVLLLCLIKEGNLFFAPSGRKLHDSCSHFGTRLGSLPLKLFGG